MNDLNSSKGSDSPLELTATNYGEINIAPPETLVQFPKTTSLEIIIDFLNDCNMTVHSDELKEKWKSFMPNYHPDKTVENQESKI